MVVVAKEVIPRAENDGAWKHILKIYLKDFVAFFWYEAFKEIDWEKPYELLEQEYLPVSMKKNMKKHNVDKLFRVCLKGVENICILLHFEIEHSKPNRIPPLPIRMFTYFYKIFDNHEENIASLVILADDDKDWRPKRYFQRIWKSEISRTYEVVKIMDFKSRKDELKNHKNLFAMAVLIQLAVIETKGQQKLRLSTKKERCMNIMSPVEREMYKEAEANVLMKMLKLKFNAIPNEYISKINSADATSLEGWVDNFVHANSLDEVFK